MPFGVDFETNIGNRDFNVINCHRLYLGEATQKSVNYTKRNDMEKETLETLRKYLMILENHYKDGIEVDFTVERNRIYITNVRIAKRTSATNLRITIDLIAEKKITLREGLERITVDNVRDTLTPRIVNLEDLELLTKGLNASPYIGVGKLTSNQNNQQEGYIIVKNEVSPDDIDFVAMSNGVITTTGDMTSHAAVVCRGIGKPAVTGARSIEIVDNGIKVKGRIIQSDVYLTINGSTGEIYLGKGKIVPVEWRANKYISMLYQLIIKYQKLLDIRDPLHTNLWGIRDFLIYNVSYHRYKYTFNRSKFSLDSITPENEKIEKDINLRYKFENVSASNKKVIEDVVWGTRLMLFRLLFHKVGIGNHDLFYRPLLNPMEYIFYHGEDCYVQYVAEEFFDINRFLDNYIEISSIKLIVQSEHYFLRDMSFLDFSNTKSPSIAYGSLNAVKYCLLVNECEVNQKDVVGFYNLLRLREGKLNFFTKLGCQKEEIIEALYRKRGPSKVMDIYRRLGLTKNGEVTRLGRSLL